MSVRSYWGYACPKCSADNRIEITSTGTCRLTPCGSEDCGDHEWDDKSEASCGSCGFSAQLVNFKVGEEGEEG